LLSIASTTLARVALVAFAIDSCAASSGMPFRFRVIEERGALERDRVVDGVGIVPRLERFVLLVRDEARRRFIVVALALRGDVVLHLLVHHRPGIRDHAIERGLLVVVPEPVPDDVGDVAELAAERRGHAERILPELIERALLRIVERVRLILGELRPASVTAI
jgi:hypothetical protein